MSYLLTAAVDNSNPPSLKFQVYASFDCHYTERAHSSDMM